jgi:hypothetical protein
MKIRAALIYLACVAITACNSKMEEPKMADAKTRVDPALAARIAQFAPTDVTADTTQLSEGDKKALAKIIEAAKRLDPLFLRQVWSRNEALQKKLETDTSPDGLARLHYFTINKGPWSRQEENTPFIEGSPQKPPQAGFYPDDMTKDEFNSWLATLPADEKPRATSFFTVIRRTPDRKLTVVPYHEEYRSILEPASKLLKEAADLTSNATLKKFLTLRADAFLTDDYFASDVAWMDLDAPIDVTIGPYETYEDELFGYKAAFEAFVTLRDDAETAKLGKFGGHLQELENNLPIDPRYRNPKLGAASPIRVVDNVFSSGDGNRGVQTAAFNLPNDEKVINEKGSKRVMLKNVQEAKFNKVLVPISKIVMDPSQQSQISFDAFFTHILAHELMHGLGPHNIKVGGRDMNVRKELKELYSAIEEAKADITGLWALQYLIDKGVVDRAMERDLYTTYLSSSFRSVRFGIAEAHGKGQAMQFNYLLDEGGIKQDPGTSTFSIDPSKIKDAVRKLSGEILTIEAEGSYDRAKALLDKYANIRPAMRAALDKLSSVPVDIEPNFTLAK